MLEWCPNILFYIYIISEENSKFFVPIDEDTVTSFAPPSYQDNSKKEGLCVTRAYHSFLCIYTSHKNNCRAKWSRAYLPQSARAIFSGSCFCGDYRICYNQYNHDRHILEKYTLIKFLLIDDIFEEWSCIGTTASDQWFLIY